MKNYTKKLAECLGALIFDVAQTSDVDEEEVIEEVFRIVNAVPNAKGLFEEKWLEE